MRRVRLAGILLVLVGAGLVAYNAPIVFLAFSLGANGWGLMEEPMWEKARQGFTIGAVIMLGGMLLVRWK